MKVRYATIKDIDLIVALEEQCFINPWNKNQYKYELEENEFSKTLLMFDDETLVGYINYWIVFDHGEINKICINEPYRRKGYGFSLLNEAFKDFRENDCLSISLEVRVSNVKAINLYEKYGFQRVITKEHYYSDGEDAYYMIKGAY